MQQNAFVALTKHFAISIKFWLLKQNVLLGQQNKFCCINFVLSASKINVFPMLHTTFFLLGGRKIDLLTPQWVIKCTLWPASRKK